MALRCVIYMKSKEGIPMTLKRITCLLAALMLLLCMIPAMAEQDDEPIAMDVTDYISGIADLDLAPYKGKIMVLFFYTADNDLAKATLPVWKKIHDDFNPEDLEIILVHAWDGEDQDDSDAAIERFQLEGMNIYEDKDCLLSSTLNVVEFPNTLILDQGGTPASGYSGQLTYATTAEYLVSLGAEQVQGAADVPAAE